MRANLKTVLMVAVTAAALAAPVRGHETDQYTLPEGREFADLGSYFNQWAYEAIEAGMRRVNQRIAQSGGRALASSTSDAAAADEIVRSVNAAFGNAYAVIEGLEIRLHSTAMKQRYPGRVVGYKQQFGNIYQHVHFVLDPRQIFRLWHATTFMVNGTYMGTDKVGHFTDMGMNYYRAYRSERKKGVSEADAIAVAVNVGTEGPLFSERGLVGYLSAGHYSNADLAANYIGFLFYRNLTEPIMLEGKEHPPMLVREGVYWKMAPHVAIDSDFFSAFVSDHYDEALNPGLYESAMRDKVYEAINERATRVLNRRTDQHGNRRPRSYFLQVQQELKTYFGQPYGHEGTQEELMSVAGACYESFAIDASPAARNAFGETPLHEAAAMGELDRMKLLIQRGADVNATVRSDERYSPEWGNTPLHDAAAEGRSGAVQLLLESGANVAATNDRGLTPLHRALAHPDVVRMLLERGAPVNAATNRGDTPLHWAAMDGQIPVMELLLIKGANARLRNHAGRTALHEAATTEVPGMVEKLVAIGAEVNAAADLGVTPLHIAASRGNRAVTDLLIGYGANVNGADQFGWTAMHSAADGGSTAVVELLVRRGASVNAVTAQQNTALHLAARRGRTAVSAWLLKGGINVNAINRFGMTSLHEAVAVGSAGTVSVLLEHGAERSARNTKGQTPVQMTKAPEILSLLRSPAATTTSDLPRSQDVAQQAGTGDVQ